ncbi:PAS domain S-box protein [Saliphagus sp. GCM10025308]
MPSELLTPALRETLAVFDGAGEPRTTPEVATAIELGRRSTYARLERLAEQGRLETKKVGANARVWWRPSRPSENVSATAPDWPAVAESLVTDALAEIEVGVFVLDEAFDVAWVNAATERYFGLDRKRVVGSDKRRLVDERIASTVADSAAFAETVLATYDENTYAERFECRVEAADGREERWLEHRSKPIESGEYAGGRVELYYDVTDRKRSERERRDRVRQLREERDLTERLLETAPVGLVVAGADGSVERINSRVRDRLGIDEGDVSELSVEDLAVYEPDGDPLSAADHPISRVIETGETITNRLVRYDGSGENRRWVSLTAAPIFGEGGSVERVVVAGKDVSDSKQRERERELEQYERIVETIDDGIYVLDSDRRFTMVNDGFASLTGYDREELIGAHAETVFEAVSVDVANEKQVELESGSLDVAALEEELCRADGTSFVVESRFDRFEFDDGETGRVGIVRDVSERVERERELEEVRRRHRTIVEHFPSGAVALVDENLRYTTFGGTPEGSRA